MLAQKTKPKKLFYGFTLIELLIVITIIALIMGGATFSFLKSESTSRNAKRAADLTAISQALELYYADHGSYPNSLGASSYWQEGGQMQGASRSCTMLANEAMCCLLGGTYAQNYQPPSGERCLPPLNTYIGSNVNLRWDPYAPDGFPQFHYASDGKTYVLVDHNYEGTPPSDHWFTNTTAPYYYCEAVHFQSTWNWTHTYFVQNPNNIKTPSPAKINPGPPGPCT